MAECFGRGRAVAAVGEALELLEHEMILGNGSGGGGDDGEEVEEEAADFNTFNYWKPTYEVEVPDDA